MSLVRPPMLMLVTDRSRSPLPLPELTQSALAGGVDLVQIREKDLGEDELLDLTKSVVSAVGDASRILVNGSIAIAQKLGIGVHLPEAGSSPSTARATLGPNRLIGRSVHSVESAQASNGADYVIAGHVFETSSKPGREPIGLDGLRSIVAASPIPVIAIGGFTRANIEAVLATGAHGVAVISAINSAEQPETAAQELRTIIDAWRQSTQMKERSMDQTATSELTINGKPVTLDAGTTVSIFLATKGLQERLVVVELNESILPRDQYASTVLNSGDRVEIVHFVGGG